MTNPCTTILGHPTGRLLLAREGYRVDMARIIEAAADNHVVIELNASPFRLDIDWRYQKQARQKGVLISIDPDAHAAAGLGELAYGVGIARKGWLEADNVLNTRDITEIRQYLRRVRMKKEIESILSKLEAMHGKPQGRAELWKPPGAHGGRGAFRPVHGREGQQGDRASFYRDTARSRIISTHPSNSSKKS